MKKQKKLLACLLILWLCWPAWLCGQGTEFWNEPELPAPPPPPPVQKKATPLPPKKVEPPPPKPVSAPPEPQPQPVLVPEPEPEGLSISDVILLMDISGSMDAAIANQPISKMASAQQSLTYFAEHMKEGTRFQLWTFSGQIKQHPNSAAAEKSSTPVLFEPIGPQNSPVRQYLKKTIQNLKTEGGTNLYQAIYQAIQYFQSSAYQVPPNTGKRYKVLVVLSDGEDDGFSSIKLEHILELKKQHPDLQLKTIGFGIQAQSTLHQTLCQIASDKQGCTLAADIPQLQHMIHSLTRS